LRACGPLERRGVPRIGGRGLAAPIAAHHVEGEQGEAGGKQGRSQALDPWGNFGSMLLSFAFLVTALILAVYLGIRLLLAKADPRQLHATSTGPRRALLEGILVEALNVKTALFFLAFLPQFLVSGTSVVMQLVVMGTVCVMLNTLVDVVAVLGAARLLRSEASRRHGARLLNKISGITLVSLGLYVAASRRGA
jgi:threonine/homoserine/homoserine lactone efflux protein